MAKPNRKATTGKPVRQHQLFPAVVALWFGALFGLGSLAVRPSLLEELVIKSRIDLLVPVAAPPLGMTARMLVALAMAALGAMIGIVIARRLARPKQEPRERKRTKLSTRDEGVGNRGSAGYAGGSTRNPGAVDQVDDETAASGAPGVLANRRRSLAIEHEKSDFVPHDMAPLPGGSPQIFDIASAGLSDVRGQAAILPEPETHAGPAKLKAAELAPPPSPIALDWANAAPVLPPAAGLAPALMPQSIEARRQMFQSASVPESEPGQAVPADGRQVFGMTAPLQPPPEQPRQIFGAPIVDDHVPREFVEAQGFRTTVFAPPEPNPLFAARAEPAPAQSAHAAPAPMSVALAAPEAYVPPLGAAPAAEPAAAAPAALAVPASVLPSPASLGIEDLSARLAESMRRRRADRAGKVAALAASAPPLADPGPAPTPVSQGLHPEPAPAHREAEAAVPAADVAPADLSPRPIPAALRPLDLTGFEEDDAAASHGFLPPRRIAFAAEDELAVTEEASIAEEDYASLLGVTPSPAVLRNPFVRVEEPEAEIAAIEPVVIFPGQAMPAPQHLTQPAAASDVPAAFRRFDAPAQAGQGQPVATNEAVSGLAPEEAEQALRSALANLQRMSGVA